MYNTETCNEYPRGCDSAKVIKVIETRSVRGAGTKESPSREVTEYWSLSGVKLAEHDPCPGTTCTVEFGDDTVPRP